MEPGSADPAFLSALIEQLPAAAFVVDEVGTVLYASEQAAALVGRRAEDLVGESVLTFVSQDTAWAYAAAVAMASDFPHQVMGPLRVTFVDGDGELRDGELWAANRLDDPMIHGVVCLISEESTATGLNEAVGTLTDGAQLGDVAVHVANAMRGYPVAADACVIARDGEGYHVTAVADVAPELVTDLSEGPWSVAMDTGIRQLHGQVTDLDHALADRAARCGYAALWAEPVPGSPSALVLWCRHPGNPSPNQLRSICRGASILSLAQRLTDSETGPAFPATLPDPDPV